MQPAKRVIGLSESYAAHARTVQAEWIDIPNREMWIQSSFDISGNEPGVEYRMATQVIKNLHILKNDPDASGKPVLIHMHICGGDWQEGMAIYDAICAMPYETTIISYTQASSMSSILLQAADKRYLMPNSHVMVHMGSVQAAGDVPGVQSFVQFAERDTETMFRIYLERMRESKKFNGLSDAKILAQFKQLLGKHGEIFLSPKDALRWNLADGIVKCFKRDGSLRVVRA